VVASQDLDNFMLSWAASSAKTLRSVDVSGTPAATNGAALYALCTTLKRLESLRLHSDNAQQQPFGTAHAVLGSELHGWTGRPLKSPLLILALKELDFQSGLLEFAADSLAEDDLFTLLAHQGRVLRRLKLGHCPKLRGECFARLLTDEPDDAFARTETPKPPGTAARDEHGWAVDTDSRVAHEAAVFAKAEAVRLSEPKTRFVDRQGEEPPMAPGAPFLGQLVGLSLIGARRLSPAGLRALASLGLPSLTDLELSGLRGGAKRHAGSLGILLRAVGPRLTSLRLADMVLDDTSAAAIADGCGPANIRSRAGTPMRTPLMLGAGAAGAGQAALFKGSGGGGGGGAFGALFGSGAAIGGAAAKRGARQYTTVLDLPSLRHLSLEYIGHPKEARAEELLDNPRRRKGDKGSRCGSTARSRSRAGLSRAHTGVAGSVANKSVTSGVSKSKTSGLQQRPGTSNADAIPLPLGTISGFNLGGGDGGGSDDGSGGGSDGQGSVLGSARGSVQSFDGMDDDVPKSPLPLAAADSGCQGQGEGQGPGAEGEGPSTDEVDPALPSLPAIKVPTTLNAVKVPVMNLGGLNLGALKGGLLSSRMSARSDAFGAQSARSEVSFADEKGKGRHSDWSGSDGSQSVGGFVRAESRPGTTTKRPGTSGSKAGSMGRPPSSARSKGSATSSAAASAAGRPTGGMTVRGHAPCLDGDGGNLVGDELHPFEPCGLMRRAHTSRTCALRSAPR